MHTHLAVGWGRDFRNEGFGDQSGVKYQLVSLVTSVQTLLRGKEDCTYMHVRNIFSATVTTGGPIKEVWLHYRGGLNIKVLEAGLEKDLFLKGSTHSCRTVCGCGEVSGSASEHEFNRATVLC